MKSKDIRKFGEHVGREGLAIRALEIMEKTIADGSYKEAIEAVGRLSVIAQACDFDYYWQAKKNRGKQLEINRCEEVMTNVLD